MGTAAPALSPAGPNGWEALLKTRTLRLTTLSGTVGTGFVVAPGLVATCAHVLGSATSLPAAVRGHVVALGREFTLEPVRDSYVLDRDSGLDLVLLRVTESPPGLGAALEPVLTSPVAEINDELWTYGHPVGGFNSGQSTTLRCVGTDRRSDLPGAPWLPHVVGRAKAGCSGSAVINTRTGAVCGMLSTSDRHESAHLVPVAEILARCPQGAEEAALHGPWPLALTEDQLAAADWRIPSPLLLDYLDTAADVADRAHPYPVIDGRTPSSLSIVYVRQFAGRTAPAETDADATTGADPSGDPERATGEGSRQHRPGPSDHQRIRADELFGLGQDILLVGAPGAGKSSLLRHAVTELAHRWHAEKDRPGVVPVRVEAKEFLKGDTPLAVIARTATTEVLAASVSGWPPHWFERAPVRGARWLVLVDGLDEAGGPQERSRVLEKIADLRRNPAVGDHYRFLVATRPLPTREQPPRMRRFDLLPLDPRQLPDFASSWFAALELTDLDRCVRRFMGRLASSGMAEPARTPLMAAMLCQLFAVDQDKPLPRGRTAVYRRFVGEILGGQRWSRSKALSPELHKAAVRSHGSTGPAALEAVRNELRGLLEHLALATYEGTRGSAVALLAQESAGHRPQNMEEQVWAELLALALPEFLRDCGLLVQRREDFVFVHQTFAEYLVASRIANDRRLTQRHFRRLFHCDPRMPGWMLRANGATEPAATSVARFLIDAWEHNEQRGLHEVLRMVARRPRGATLISTLIDDGAEIDETARRSATTVLHSAARNGDHNAAIALARTGDPRGAALLLRAATAQDSAADTQLDAVCALADLGDPRGTDLLRERTADAGDPGCVRAAEELIRRTGLDGEVLVRLARDRSAPPATRKNAVRALDRLGLPGGTEALKARLTDTRETAEARLAAARELIVSEISGVAGPLADLVRAELPDGQRHEALQLLTTAGRSRKEAAHVSRLLEDLAADHGLPSELRFAVVQSLARPKYRSLVHRAVVEDQKAPGALRLKALKELPDLIDDHDMDILLPVLADPAATLADRSTAARLLPPGALRHGAVQLALAALLKAHALPHEDRLALVAHLAPEHQQPRAQQGPPDGAKDASWWYDTVCELVRDAALPDPQRRRLMEELKSRGGGGRLAELALSAGLPGVLRLVAAREAIEAATRDRAGTQDRPWSARDAALRVSRRLASTAVFVWDTAAPVARKVPSALSAVKNAIRQVLGLFLRLPFLALLAGLPFMIAVVANAYAAACVAETPPADWKLRVYFAVAAVVITALYLGASELAETAPRARRMLLWGLAAGAALGLLRAPGVPALNAMGDYLVGVVPWDGHLRE
ncbi:trypsin-like peptidase domain-containing protein [Streptomyces sp. NPDC059070]|uniref:trypsin-like peptidase domain-containing protein n=1 Tax=Streptomyces sp. NPDC059070 TaxID=3346713 RepID=UPI00367DD492